MLQLRAAGLEDAALLLAWRNDAVTRAASHSPDEIPLDVHLRWLESVLADPARQLWIVEEGLEPVGSLRVDGEADGGALLSWMVAPAARGRGVGRRMLSLLLARLEGPLRAEIRADNHASIRMAEAVGLECAGERGGVLHYLRPARARNS